MKRKRVATRISSKLYSLGFEQHYGNSRFDIQNTIKRDSRI